MAAYLDSFRPAPRLNVLICTIDADSLPNGGDWPWWLATRSGAGQVLHLLCDLSLAAEERVFGQKRPAGGKPSTGASGRVIWPAWWGSAGPGRIWFLGRPSTTPRRRWPWVWLNAVVPAGPSWKAEGVRWGPRRAAPRAHGDPLPQGRLSMPKPTALAGLAGTGRSGTHLFYRTAEAPEGRMPFCKKGIRISPMKPGCPEATSAGDIPRTRKLQLISRPTGFVVSVLGRPVSPPAHLRFCLSLHTRLLQKLPAD